MKTLIFLDYFTPAFKAGGPIRIFEAVAKTASPANSVRILTQDTDLGSSKPLEDVKSNTVQKFANAEVTYVSSERRSLKAIRQLIADHGPTCIHLNSFFSRTWTMKVLLLRWIGAINARTFLSPHGEFAASALAIKSGRKRIFLHVGRAIGLFRGLHWIATAPKEVAEIRALFGNSAKIELIPPPFPTVYPHTSARKAKGKLRLIFFARLSAMKNIGFLLGVLPRVQGEVEFDIYGPVDPEYESTWNEIFGKLRELAAEKIRVSYKGPIPSSQSLATLSRYDLFVQPSLSENFGFSIVEALAAGTPVLISDRTPWNEINEVGLGAALSLDQPDAWVQALQDYVDLEHEGWAKISERATKWVESKDASGKELHSIYMNT